MYMDRPNHGACPELSPGPQAVPCLPFPPSACAKAIQIPGPSLALLPRPTGPLKWGTEAPWGF